MRALWLILLVPLLASAQLATTPGGGVMWYKKPPAAAGGGVAVLEWSTNYASSTTASSHTLTFPSVTAGRLMVVTIVADDYIGTVPSGWTTNAAAPDFTGTYIMSKVAAGGETSVAVALKSSVSCCMWMGIWSGMTASPFDVKANAIGQTASINTGTTATTAQAKELLIAVVGVSSSDATITAWANSMVAANGGGGQSTVAGTSILNGTATNSTSSTGTYTTTATYGDTTSNASGAIAAYKIQ